MALKPYLQLVRLPNLFTAAADPLAGWIVAWGTLDEPRRWLPLLGASVLIYAGGIVLNDVFDVEVDRRERPGRPLPSGRVPYRLAAAFGVLALLAGPAVAALSGSMASALVAGWLAVVVLLYDAGAKRSPLGPIVMGACRTGNLLLGFSQTGAMGGRPAWLIAVAFGLFVAGVTWISRSEVETGRRRGIAFGLAVELAALVGLTLASMWLFRLIDQTQRFPLLGFALWAVLIQVILRAGRRALAEPVPAVVQAAVKTGVLSLVWLDVALVATARDPASAWPVAALWVPAFLLARWLYAT